MGFIDVFWPTVAANLAAAFIFAIPFLTIWLNLQNRGRQMQTSSYKKVRTASLMVRFTLSLVRRKQRRSDFRSWALKERQREYLLELLSEGPKARIILARRLANAVRSTAGSIDFWDIAPPLAMLIEAGESLTLEQFGQLPQSRFDSMTCAERDDWLKSRPLGELARWSVTLSSVERTRWESWLKSSGKAHEL